MSIKSRGLLFLLGGFEVNRGPRLFGFVGLCRARFGMPVQSVGLIDKGIGGIFYYTDS